MVCFKAIEDKTMASNSLINRESIIYSLNKLEKGLNQRIKSVFKLVAIMNSLLKISMNSSLSKILRRLQSNLGKLSNLRKSR